MGNIVPKDLDIGTKLWSKHWACSPRPGPAGEAAGTMHNIVRSQSAVAEVGEAVASVVGVAM